jgi:hypothetical protein
VTMLPSRMVISVAEATTPSASRRVEMVMRGTLADSSVVDDLVRTYFVGWRTRRTGG